jgi:spore coat protein U-like protein
MTDETSDLCARSRDAARARMLGRARLLACAALLAAASRTALAAPRCDFSSHADANFGAYSVLDQNPNTNGVGSITVHCQNGNGSSEVTLSTGQSNSYGTRVMKNGANTLNYNLYTSATRNVVWGDHTGASGTVFADGNHETILSIYGKIPAGQDVAVGVYTDNIVVTVNF